MMFPRSEWLFRILASVLFVLVHIVGCNYIEKRLGLIRARILGGNESTGDFLAFIDAHVRVAPDWLHEPYSILLHHPNSLVNYINFNLDPKTFLPLNAWKGLGRFGM